MKVVAIKLVSIVVRVYIFIRSWKSLSVPLRSVWEGSQKIKYSA